MPGSTSPSPTQVSSVGVPYGWYSCGMSMDGGSSPTGSQKSSALSSLRWEQEPHTKRALPGQPLSCMWASRMPL